MELSATREVGDGGERGVEEAELRLLNGAQTDHRNYGCGVGPFRPQWLLKFATPQWFMAVFGLLGTVQAMATVYFTATLTTMERRFAIPSKTTGYMLAGNEVSQILFSLILSYAGGQRNRPVWLSWGVAISALSCFVLTLPHIIYGPGEKAYSLTQEYSGSFTANRTKFDLKVKGTCTSEVSPTECDSSDFSMMPPVLIFISQFVLGIGTTLYHALGQTYLDDNTKKKKTPFLLAVTMSLRTIGPAFAFILGSICLSIYVDPSLTPVINKKDPRWIGAWWLGWIILGSTMMLTSVLIAMFPKALPQINKVKQASVTNGQSVQYRVKTTKPPPMKEFPVAIKRILRNKILVINILGSVLYVLGASSYITFMAKYIEVIFEKSAATANVVVGPGIFIATVFGFLISGYIISKYKPRASYVLGWNVIVGIAFVLGEVIIAFISCKNTNLVGFNSTNNSLNIINTCNVGCGCENLQYSPVCLVEKQLTFYSACHAGCRTVTKQNGTKVFENCACVPADLLNEPLNPFPDPKRFVNYAMPLIDGPCPSECGRSFQIMIVIACLINFMGASGKIGNILVNYRSVRPEDKSLAQGFVLLTLSVVAFIPGPIIFGYLIDATCIIWDTSCKERGNCWFYNRTSFRMNLNFTSAVFTTVGVILDIFVWYWGRDLRLYDDEGGLRKRPESTRL